MIKYRPDSILEIRERENKKIDVKNELKLLRAQNQALTERNEFIEDLIAEMATQVYNM